MRFALRSRSGQTTVEYILMLAVAVVLFLLVYRSFLKPWGSSLGERLSQRVERFFRRDSLHRLPIRGR